MIIFIPLSILQGKSDWAIACSEFPIRQCPICLAETIIGHGRRHKQAHDEAHDWICVRRGICKLCGTTFTFLPILSPPYGHYSWVARSHAVRDYFVEGKPLESATPLVKDPDKLPSPSTLRRWFRSLDSPILYQSFAAMDSTCNTSSSTEELAGVRKDSSFPFLEQIVQAARQRLATQSWKSLAPFLQILLPLRC